jgi:hypothetical protein
LIFNIKLFFLNGMPEKVKKYKVFAGYKRVALMGILPIITSCGIAFPLEVHGPGKNKIFSGTFCP